MSKGQFAVAGLGVMGRMVALNIERNGFRVVAYNRGIENAGHMRTAAEGKNVQVTQSIQEMVDSLEKTRRVLLMVTAGRGTDAVIAELRKLLEPGGRHHRRRKLALPRHQSAPRRTIENGNPLHRLRHQRR